MVEFIQVHLFATLAFALVALIVLALLILAFIVWRQIGRIETATPAGNLARRETEPSLSRTYALRTLTKDNWAEFERTVLDLITVIVVAHRVSSPDGGLYEAVRDNLQRGVRYKFLVSQSTAIAQENAWYGIFKQIAHGLASDGLLIGAVEDAVEILRLESEWDDYPYVFYLSGTRIANTEKTDKAVAFRGTDQKKGICKSYKEVPPEEAHTLARVIMQDAPDRIVDAMRPAVKSTFDTPLPGGLTAPVDLDVTKSQPA